MSVSDRLKNRLKNVPGVTDADIDAFVTDAEQESGLSKEEKPDAIFYLALSFAYEFAATNAANFFSYQDGEETVNKSMIFDNYMKLAIDARNKYQKYRRGRGASQTHVGRADAR